MIHQNLEIDNAAVNDNDDGSLRLDSLQQLQPEKHNKLQLLDDDDNNATIATTEDASSSSWGTCSIISETTAVPHQQQHEQQQSHQRRRRVQLPGDENDDSRSSNHVANIIQFHHDEMEPWSDEELYAYFTQPDDVKRFDMDVKATIQHWINYKKGNIPHFDEDIFTMRGLEEALDHLRCCKNDNNNNKNNASTCSSSASTRIRRTSRHEVKNMHTKGVLEEVERQKKKRNNNNNYSRQLDDDDDAEELRRVSERLSESARQQAIRTAELDQLAVRDLLQHTNNNNMTSFRRQSEPAAAPSKKAILHQTKSCDTVVEEDNNKKTRRKSIFSFIKINKKKDR